VRITGGPFKDVEGVVKRIKKNKSVVVQIEGIAAVAIAFVPANYLTLI
jgi:transcription antitermination factor NusG